MTKRQLGKKLQDYVPYVRWHVGLVVCGEINRKFINSSQYGEKNALEIKLLDPCEFSKSDGEVLSLKAGDLVAVTSMAGLSTAMTLDVGVTVQMEATGRKELGGGKKPAWEFEVTYE